MSLPETERSASRRSTKLKVRFNFTIRRNRIVEATIRREKGRELVLLSPPSKGDSETTALQIELSEDIENISFLEKDAIVLFSDDHSSTEPPPRRQLIGEDPDADAPAEPSDKYDDQEKTPPVHFLSDDHTPNEPKLASIDVL